MTTSAYGAPAADKPFEPMQIDRRDLGPEDVHIDIAYCGLCHTDLHCARDWPTTRYPCVPGHEIVGTVTAVGDAVTRHAVGDVVGVGCMVDSCRSCDPCREEEEQFCAAGSTQTYNSPTADAPGYTMGGYAKAIVVDQHFVLKITHDAKDLAAVSPLLCAGITTYSALKYHGVGPGMRVGIVGIGGVGHVGVRIARALGAHVVAFTTSASKQGDALDLGAHEVVVSRDADAMAACADSLDFIVNTVAAGHSLDTYLSLLKRGGAMALLGVPNSPHEPPNPRILFRRRSLTGSLIGGIAETQEMLDFCAEHGIVADIEMVAADQIDTAYERMAKGDVKYRFVLDTATI